MLETSNLVCKYKHIYTFYYQGPLNFADAIIFLAKNQRFLRKIALLLKAVVGELC